MRVRRRILMAGATFLLAAATGHVMQSGDTISARLRSLSTAKEAVQPVPGATVVTPLQASLVAEGAAAAAEPATPAAMVATEAALRPLPDLPDLPAAEPTPFAAGVLLSVRIDGLDTYQRPISDADARYDAFGIFCGAPVLTLDGAGSGLLAVTVAAPCHPVERVTFRHAGLIFTMQTDFAGSIAFVLPALTRNAVVSIDFHDGDKASAVRRLEGLDVLTRVAVQWRGRPGFHLNAYENGAVHGEPSHVAAAAPRDPTTAEGGFLTLLGDPAVEAPMLAEVYTLPIGAAARKVAADMTIEVEVTASGCGRVLHGEALYARAGAEPRRAPLRLAMPGCDAMGDFVMLSLPDPTAPVSIAAADQ